MTAPLDNTMVVLIGFAGTGKYTVGRLLAARAGARLVDNHLINNPVFTVVGADGITPLPAPVWEKVSAIRRLVYDSIREIAPPGLGYVFTLELRESDPAAHRAFRDLVELAETRGALLVPVRLLCDLEELCRRVVSPARVGMLKDISPENARRKFAAHTVLDPKHENTFSLDVTTLAPEESADAVLREVERIKSGRRTHV